MRARSTRGRAAGMERRKQVNIRLEPGVYQVLAAIAHQEGRSISQLARQLLEESLPQRMRTQAIADDSSGQEIAPLAAAGGAFDWLAEEPDLYDDTCGEPL